MSTGKSGETRMEGIGLDELFVILSNERRRNSIKVMHDEGPVPKDRLADRLLEMEDAKRKSIFVSLHQNHLPRMLDGGVIAETGSGYELREGGRIAYRIIRFSEMLLGESGIGRSDRILKALFNRM